MRRMPPVLRSSASAFFLAGLCLQGVFGPVAAQAKYAPFPFIYLPSQPTESVAARLAAQNALFKEQFEDDMRASPESETARGDYRDNAVLDDYSLAASTKQNAVDRAYRAKLAAISAEGFPEQDRISHDLLLHVLDNRIADYELKNYEMPISQMQGIHNSLADLPNSVPLDTVQHYEDYIARLHQIPRAFEQTLEVLRQGEKDGLMPVRILLEQIPAQCEGTITENPFLAPTKKFPASILRGGPEALDRGDRGSGGFRSVARLSALRGIYRKGLRSAWPQHNRVEQLAGRRSTLPASDSRANDHRYVTGRDSCAGAARGRTNQWTAHQSCDQSRLQRSEQLSRRDSIAIRSMYPNLRIRSSKIFGAMSVKCSRICQNCSEFSRKLR